MREDLRAAMKARDHVAVAALRSALAAIANAEAQDADLAPSAASTTSEHVAGAVSGLGATEVDRRVLTHADVQAVLTQEVEERRTAAEQLQRAGRPEDSERLLREADALSPYLVPGTPTLD
jgi:uncharacterized protein